MIQLLNAFFEICMLRTAPQDLPYSKLLLGFSLAAYTFISLLLSVLSIPDANPLIVAIIDVLLIIGLLATLLWIRDLWSRYVQTLTALAGCGAFIGLLACPLLWWQRQVGAEFSEAVFPSIIYFVLLFWNLAIIGHILKHALTTHKIAGLILAIFYMFISYNVSRVLFFPVS